MAVLVEAISVIIRRDVVEALYPGGRRGFARHAPNATLCTDGELFRIGFMTTADVHAYVSGLEAAGLVFQKEGQAADLAVADQLRGLTIPAPWLEFGKVEIGGVKVSACWLAGGGSRDVAVPDGWKYESSLSAQHGFVDDGEIDGRLKYLRYEDGLDVYLDNVTGKEVFFGRPNIKGDSESAINARLTTICHEVQGIDEKVNASVDEHGRKSLFHRLDGELLPYTQAVIARGGSQAAFAYFARGLILRVLNHQPEAELAFRQCNDLMPDVINTLLELVRCLGKQGKHDEALPFARKAVEVEPEGAAAWGNLASCLVDCGQREEARRAIEFAITLDPDDPINRYIRGKVEKSFG